MFVVRELVHLPVYLFSELVMLLAMLISTQFLSVSNTILDSHDQIQITKCCAQSERIDLESNSCIPNINQVQFKVDTIGLNITASKWVVEPNYIPYAFRYGLCTGNIIRDYRITQMGMGSMIQYTGDQSYYQFYNKYCIDVDHKTGDQIAITCNDTLVVKKCCNLTSSLTNPPGCQPTSDAIYLNDLSDILFGDGEMKNIEFEFGSENQLDNYEINENFGMLNFVFDENHEMIRFNNRTDFCLDKQNGEWIVLVASDETIGFWFYRLIICLLLILSVLVMLMTLYCLYKRGLIGKCKFLDKFAFPFLISGPSKSIEVNVNQSKIP